MTKSEKKDSVALNPFVKVMENAILANVFYMDSLHQIGGNENSILFNAALTQLVRVHA